MIIDRMIKDYNSYYKSINNQDFIYECISSLNKDFSLLLQEIILDLSDETLSIIFVIYYHMITKII